MHSYLVYSDYEQCAKSLDSTRLHDQHIQALIILRSLAKVHEKNKRTGLHGFEKRPVAQMWKGHELHLAKFAKALCYELLVNRPLSKKENSLSKRKKNYANWRATAEEMEDLNFPDDPPSLIGDEEFHSAIRSLLLYRGIQSNTFRKWKRGEYPDHLCTRFLQPKKASWKREDYINIWDHLGQPPSLWYGDLGWTDEPTDLKFFYLENRVPQMKKEIQRKIDRPIPTYYAEKKIVVAEVDEDAILNEDEND